MAVLSSRTMSFFVMPSLNQACTSPMRRTGKEQLLRKLQSLASNGNASLCSLLSVDSDDESVIRYLDDLGVDDDDDDNDQDFP